MHGLKILHRDIKVSNKLFLDSKYFSAWWDCKIGWYECVKGIWRRALYNANWDTILCKSRSMERSALQLKIWHLVFGMYFIWNNLPKTSIFFWWFGITLQESKSWNLLENTIKLFIRFSDIDSNAFTNKSWSAPFLLKNFRTQNCQETYELTLEK